MRRTFSWEIDAEVILSIQIKLFLSGGSLMVIVELVESN